MMNKESKILETRPHPASFLWSYLLWIYLFIVSVATYLDPNIYSPLCGRISFVSCNHIAFASWLVLVIAPFLVKAYKDVSIGYLLLGILIVALGPILQVLGYGSWEYSYITGIVLGLIGVAAIEAHRRAHHYTITDRRVIIEYNSFYKKRRRDLVYERVQEFIVEKPLLGRIFNFGHIFPITASGIGTGSDAITVGGGVDAKGVIGGVASTRTVEMPRAKSFYILYGIPDPESVYDKLVNLQSMSQSAPYLRELVTDMKKLVEDKEK